MTCCEYFPVLRSSRSLRFPNQIGWLSRKKPSDGIGTKKTKCGKRTSFRRRILTGAGIALKQSVGVLRGANFSPNGDGTERSWSAVRLMVSSSCFVHFAAEDTWRTTTNETKGYRGRASLRIFRIYRWQISHLSEVPEEVHR